LLDEIHRAVTQVNARRLVFDSVAALGLPYADMVSLRRDVLRLCAMLRELGCTTLLNTEMPDSDHITRFGIEQFVAQGAIVLHVAQTYRGIEIRKMRGTRHDTNIHRMRITDRGLVVSPASILSRKTSLHKPCFALNFARLTCAFSFGAAPEPLFQSGIDFTVNFSIANRSDIVPIKDVTIQLHHIGQDIAFP
jgi:hypothetical protein